MKWKDFTQRVTDVTKTALETAQQVQQRLNVAVNSPPALRTGSQEERVRNDGTFYQRDEVMGGTQGPEAERGPPPPPPPPPPFSASPPFPHMASTVPSSVADGVPVVVDPKAVPPQGQHLGAAAVRSESATQSNTASLTSQGHALQLPTYNDSSSILTSFASPLLLATDAGNYEAFSGHYAPAIAPHDPNIGKTEAQQTHAADISLESTPSSEDVDDGKDIPPDVDLLGQGDDNGLDNLPAVMPQQLLTNVRGETANSGSASGNLRDGNTFFEASSSQSLISTVHNVPRPQLEQALISALRKNNALTEQLRQSETDAAAARDALINTTRHLEQLQDTYDTAISTHLREVASLKSQIEAGAVLSRHQGEELETLVQRQRQYESKVNTLELRNEELRHLRTELSGQLDVVVRETTEATQRIDELTKIEQRLREENRTLREALDKTTAASTESVCSSKARSSNKDERATQAAGTQTDTAISTTREHPSDLIEPDDPDLAHLSELQNGVTSKADDGLVQNQRLRYSSLSRSKETAEDASIRRGVHVELHEKGALPGFAVDEPQTINLTVQGSPTTESPSAMMSYQTDTRPEMQNETSLCLALDAAQQRLQKTEELLRDAEVRLTNAEEENRHLVSQRKHLEANVTELEQLVSSYELRGRAAKESMEVAVNDLTIRFENNRRQLESECATVNAKLHTVSQDYAVERASLLSEKEELRRCLTDARATRRRSIKLTIQPLGGLALYNEYESIHKESADVDVDSSIAGVLENLRRRLAEGLTDEEQRALRSFFSNVIEETTGFMSCLQTSQLETSVLKEDRLSFSGEQNETTIMKEESQFSATTEVTVTLQGDATPNAMENNTSMRRIESLESLVDVLTKEKTVLLERIQELELRLSEVPTSLPPPPPPLPPSHLPPLEPSRLAHVPRLLTELLQVLVQQSLALSHAESANVIDNVVSQIDCVLQAIQERLPDDTRAEIVSAAGSLVAQFAQQAKTRLLLLRQFAELQDDILLKRNEIQLLEGQVQQLNANSGNLVTQKNAEDDASVSDPESQQQKLQADERVAENARLVDEIQRLRVSEDRVMQQNSRRRTLVSQAHSQLTELKDKLRQTAQERNAFEEELQKVRSDLATMRIKVEYHTRAPTKELLEKLGLQTAVVLKVTDPVTQSIWCCLSTTKQPPEKQEKESANMGEAMDQSAGISWWKETELQTELQDASITPLQTKHNTEITRYQKLVEQLELKTRFLEKRLKQTESQFAEYKQRAAAALASHKIDVVRQETTEDADLPPCSFQDRESVVIPCPKCPLLQQELNALREKAEELAQAMNKSSTENRQMTVTVARLEESLSMKSNQIESLTMELGQKEGEYKTRLASFEELVESLRTELLAQHDRIRMLTLSLAEHRSTLRHSPPQSSLDTLQQDAISDHQSCASEQQPPLSVTAPVQSTSSQNDDNMSLSSARDTVGVVSSNAASPLPSQCMVVRHTNIQNHSDTRELKRQIRLLERRVYEEQHQQTLMIDQITCLKRELRKTETLLSIQLKEQNDLTRGVPIEFVRNTILKFLETDPPGADEHECLIPVLSSIFALTGEEIQRMHRRRQEVHDQAGWLNVRSIFGRRASPA